jgi:hypothetical protein
MNDVIGYPSLPEDFTVEGQGGGPGSPAIDEADVYSFTIACGSRRGLRSLFVAFHELALVDGSLPEELAGRATVTINALNLFFLICGTKEHLVSEYDRRTVTSPGNG